MLHIIACNGGFLDIIKYLNSERQLDPHSMERDSLTAVHVASLMGFFGTLWYLIEECRYNPSHSDNTGLTPLHLASCGRRLQAMHAESYLIADQ